MESTAIVLQPVTILLQIIVAKGARQCVYHLPNCRRLSSIAHINLVTQARLSRWRLVGPRDVAVFTLTDGAQTMLPIERLPGTGVRKPCVTRRSIISGILSPQRPHSIHHAMVNPECWISRRGEEVTSGVATVATSQPRKFSPSGSLFQIPDSVMNTAVRSDLRCVWHTFRQQTIFFKVRLQQQAL